jgi:hypothetical protein
MVCRLMRFRSDGLRRLVSCCLVTAEEKRAADESTITILYARSDPRSFEQLQHNERSGHVEVTGESFRPADDRRELAEAGGLYLPRRPAYPVVAKDTAHRLVVFKSFARTKIIAPVSMATTLIIRAES